MYLNYYLNIMDFKAELNRFIEIFEGELTKQELRQFNFNWMARTTSVGIPDCDAVTVDEGFNKLSEIVERKSESTRKLMKISENFDKILNEFYRYRYDRFYMGFDDKDDLFQYVENLFNVLDNFHQKNFIGVDEDASEQNLKSFLMTTYDGLIVEYFEDDIFNCKCGFVDKLDIVREFASNYDGNSFEDMEYMQMLNQEKTFKDVFNHLNLYCQTFIYCDEDGNPSKDNYTFPLIMDCIGWRR